MEQRPLEKEGKVFLILLDVFLVLLTLKQISFWLALYVGLLFFSIIFLTVRTQLKEKRRAR